MEKFTPTTDVMNKTEIIRALNDGLKRLSLGFDEFEEPIMAAEVVSRKDGVEVTCTDGTKFSLELNM